MKLFIVKRLYGNRKCRCGEQMKKDTLQAKVASSVGSFRNLTHAFICVKCCLKLIEEYRKMIEKEVGDGTQEM